MNLSRGDAGQLYWRRKWRTGCIRQGGEIGGGTLSASSYKDVRIIRADCQAKVAFVARWTAVVGRPDFGAGNPVVGKRQRWGVPGLHSVDEDNVPILQPGNIKSAAIVAERDSHSSSTIYLSVPRHPDLGTRRGVVNDGGCAPIGDRDGAGVDAEASHRQVVS